MKKQKLRTYPIRGLLIFLLLDIVLSLAALGYFIWDRSTLLISILVYIFCGLFALIGLIVLADQLFHYVEVKDNRLINHIFWNKKVLPFEKIHKVMLVDEMYLIYSKKKRFCIMPSHIRGSNEIILYLESHGISLSQKEDEQ
ncbi:MAG TPA: hypothetical protein PKO28_00935 [Bacilli bacterium]|nr:hypothetical protein [Bacilli bacterium]HPS18797.1 hypothetical protein [Bacilli bacterium]